MVTAQNDFPASFDELRSRTPFVNSMANNIMSRCDLLWRRRVPYPPYLFNETRNNNIDHTNYLNSNNGHF